MPKTKEPFTTVKSAYRNVTGDSATVIRKGSKAGAEYAKNLGENVGDILSSSRADQAAYKARSGNDIPETAKGVGIARRGAQSIAADQVVNTIKDKARRDKYAK
jgi:hypothetical protein